MDRSCSFTHPLTPSRQGRGSWENEMEIKVPEVGESVVEALVAKWHKKDGERVAKDEPLCEIETDKITMELNAEVDGVLEGRSRKGRRSG